MSLKKNMSIYTPSIQQKPITLKLPGFGGPTIGSNWDPRATLETLASVMTCAGVGKILHKAGRKKEWLYEWKVTGFLEKKLLGPIYWNSPEKVQRALSNYPWVFNWNPVDGSWGDHLILRSCDSKMGIQEYTIINPHTDDRTQQGLSN